MTRLISALAAFVVVLGLALVGTPAATAQSAGGVQGTVLEVTPGGTVPWVGYVVLIDPADGSVEASVLAGGDGSFTLSGIADGTYRVQLGQTATTAVLYWPGTPDVSSADDIVVSGGAVVQLGETSLQQAGRVEADVRFQPVGGALEPAAAEVELWRLDEAEGTYRFYMSDTTNSGTGKVDLTLVPAGTYAVWARPTDLGDLLGPEWYTDSRYFAERTDVVVEAGKSTALAYMVLEERYFDTWRTAGASRFETAVEISRVMFPVDDGERARPPVVYLVNAYNYPDALAAGPAAIRQGGSILPVARDFAPDSILEELADLDPERIVVAGGVNAVSETVLDQVRAAVPGADVDRIGEATRYETGRALVEDAFPGGSTAAFIATGRNYPDALAAGAAAGYVGGPVILVDGLAGGLDAATQDLLADLGVEDVFIAGGVSVVGDGVESALEALLGADHVHRLAGGNRFETAAAINAEIFADASEIGFVASGYSFPDALAGGPLAGAYGAPLYLSLDWCMPDPTFYGLWDGQAQGIWLLGGEAVLGPDVEEFAECI